MRNLLLALALLASTPAFAETVAVDSPRWRITGEQSRVVEHLGRRALYLKNAEARLPDARFDTGVIEFDVATDGERGFPGVAFRGVDDGNYENFYIRPHQSGNPDANQYTPVFNGAPGWQIYYGTQYSSPTRYRFNAWMHIRIEVAADSARVYIDSAEPVLVIPDLKRDRQAGYLALGGLFEGYYSNFSYTPGDQPDAPRATAEELPAGLVRVFNVGQAMPEADAFAAAASGHLTQTSWTRLEIETNGIANLARVATWTREAPAVLARVSVRSDRARTVRMRLGFSDRVRLYLNGALVFDGDDTYRSRDYRFLGTVGLYDALHLPLRRGVNEIVYAVSETQGGWAAAAAFDDMTGLTLDPR